MTVTHNIKLKAGLMSAKAKVTDKLSDGKISGTIKGPMGNMQFEGHRITDYVPLSWPPVPFCFSTFMERL
jgi:hypothetical protein